MLPMMRLASCLAAFVLTCCVGNGSRPDHDVLTQCWHATRVGAAGQTYEVSFEAILIPGIEGSTVARSRACPDVRMGFGAVPPSVRERLRRIGYSVPGSTLGAGLRGRARVMPLERRTGHFLSVRVIEMIELKRMTDDETQRFIDEYRIG